MSAAHAIACQRAATMGRRAAALLADSLTVEQGMPPAPSDIAAWKLIHTEAQWTCDVECECDECQEIFDAFEEAWEQEWLDRFEDDELAEVVR
ncbi:hypothetical protein [Enterococcus hirae]|uniref:hypothetical protein n=1 Tax=Enterococcus hirae TaxID=1354 RepID=UPI00136CD590|nr:hypothetical protein [Enterococcus hirae]NAE18276.1 hypothetical protein [Enterococcus hirae]